MTETNNRETVFETVSEGIATQGSKRELAVDSKSTGKRELKGAKNKGLDISALILVAVLLAAGAVLKMTVGTVVNFFGMKPNFIIAMYCLAILLVRPRVYQAAIIGLIAGGICQLLPGTPYINFISELLGALAMVLLILIPMKIGKLNLQPVVGTFLSTVISGGSFTLCLFIFLGADASSLVAYVPIVLTTALINSIIVQILYLPLCKVLKKDSPEAALS